ncbi:Uncharacterised protein [Raoultella ornithinolytica]|nr:Uncharacterised protein [Raoultella ornithinolytica]
MPVMKIVTVLPGFQWYRKTSVLVLSQVTGESCPAILCTVSASCPYCRTVLTGLSVQQLNMMIHLTILIRFMSVAISMPGLD